MENSLNLVKQSYLGAVEAIQYGFYMLQKHIKNWGIVYGIYLLTQLIIGGAIAIFAFVSLAGLQMNNFMYDDYMYEDYMYDMLEFIDFGAIFGGIIMIYLIAIIFSFISSTAENLFTSKSYYSEWEIKTQKRGFGHYLGKTIKFSIGIVILTTVLIIPIVIIFGILIFIAALAESGTLMFIFALLMMLAWIAVAMIASFYVVALRYEYIVNNYRFWDSVGKVNKVVKGNFLDIMGFGLVYSLLMLGVWVVVFIVIFVVSFIPFLSVFVTPLITVALTVVCFFAYTVKYMNLKYNSSMNVFPEGFLDEGNVENNNGNTVSHNQTIVTPVAQNRPSYDNLEKKVEETFVDDSYGEIEEMTEIKDVFSDEENTNS